MSEIPQEAYDIVERIRGTQNESLGMLLFYLLKELSYTNNYLQRWDENFEGIESRLSGHRDP